MKGVMVLPTFSTWIQKREVKPPEADRLLPLIAQAGKQGMNRGQIGAATTLERDVLDSFLDGLVRVGVLTVVDQGGLRIYRAV